MLQSRYGRDCEPEPRGRQREVMKRKGPQRRGGRWVPKGDRDPLEKLAVMVAA